jgi:hypothetical protein
LLLFICFQGFQQNSQAQKSDKWMYTTTIINTSSLSTKDLNNLGLQGWEAVSIQGFGENNSQAVVLLKQKW